MATDLPLARASARAAPGAALVLLATLATLAVAFALKSPCLVHYPVHHQPKSCYNDVQTLWDSRHLAQHAFPYQGTVTRVSSHGDALLNAVLGPGQIEYPVVTGTFAWLTSLLTDDRSTFLVVTAVALTPFALLTAHALQRLTARRALLFALSPELVAYAFLNWDLLPVTATATAIWAWRRGHPAAAGALLAVGASAKLWPGFLVVPLLLHLLLDRDARTAARTMVAAVVTTLALNLPFLLANPSGWSGPFVAQSVRTNDYTTNSVWYVLARHAPLDTLNLVSALTVLTAWAVLLVVGLRRRVLTGAYPWIAVGAAMVSAYVLLGRVDSPQYGLWFLPFLVVLRVPTRWVVLFVASDVWLWLQWSWLWTWPHSLLYPAQLARMAVVAVTTVVLVRSGTALRDAPGDPGVSAAAAAQRGRTQRLGSRAPGPRAAPGPVPR